MRFQTRSLPGESVETNEINFAYRGNPRIIDRSSDPEKRDDFNVLLISLDTLRPDKLGIYGNTRSPSPFIDSLGAHGIVFKQAFSQSCYTLPSHMALFTSLMPSAHGVTHWTRKLRADIPTLAQVFKLKGYSTAAFTGGGLVAGQYGFKKFFDVYYENYLLANKENEDRTGFIYDECSEWLKKNYQTPYFVFFHTYEVHTPHAHNTFVPDSLKSVPYEDMNRYEKEIYDYARYDSGILVADKFVGKLVEVLKELKVLKKTIIVITSDHGEHLWDREPKFAHAHGHSLYRDQIWIPLILSNPILFPDHGEVKNIVRLIDVPPTLFDYLGMDPHYSYHGRSLRPFIEGSKNVPELVNYSECIQEGPERKSLVAGNYHYIYIPSSISPEDSMFFSQQKATPTEKREFFDMVSDSGELHNIAGEEKNLVIHLQALIDEYMKISDSGGVPAGELEEMDETLLMQLRALGYIK